MQQRLTCFLQRASEAESGEAVALARAAGWQSAWQETGALDRERM